MLQALGLRKADSSSNLSRTDNDSMSLMILNEYHNFELVLKAMDYVLDDQGKKGIDLINKSMAENKSKDAIHVLGLGVIQFLEATMGFETETMKLAQATLSESENLSYKNKTLHEKLQLKTSSIYPPGTQYAVTYAEANLLNALIMLLSESVIESAKALYKLRKAYHTLDEINKSIIRHKKTSSLYNSSKPSASTPNLSSTNNSSISSLYEKVDSSFSDLNLNDNDLKFKCIPVKLTEKQKNDVRFLKLTEKIYQLRKSRFVGDNIGNSAALTRERDDIGLKQPEESNESTESDTQNDESDESFVDASEQEESNHECLFKTDSLTIDEFIHSGVNLCFGILQVVLSLIPPAIGKVLAIVGFKGSRENGLRMLWNATNERNIHGAIATLGLLVFYDGPFQFTDTDFDVPSTGGEKNDNRVDAKSIQSHAFDMTGEATLLHPGKKLEKILLRARAYFPNSVLWLLQEGRMLASRGRLIEAVNLMNSASNPGARKIEMKQAEALLVFDKAMILVYLHRYDEAAENFIKMVSLNSWSHGLYMYMAGSCYLENYRMCRMGLYKLKDNEDLAEKTEYFKKLAKKYLLKGPEYLENNNKKSGFFSNKKMPMDKYMIRKMEAISKTQKRYPKLDFVDCIGSSLVHEFSYFWNAYNRMDEDNLDLSYKMLTYSSDKSFALIPEAESESLIRVFFQSLILRRLGKVNEGAKLLDEHVIKDNVLIYEGQNVEIPLNGKLTAKYNKRIEDPWLYPTALYERAIFTWKLDGLSNIEEVKEWLTKALNYAEDYELSSRTGMRIKAAMDRLEGY